MPVFELSKEIDNIEGAKPLPEGWYDVRIATDPTLEPNRAKRDSGDDHPKAGDNIVLRLRTLSSTPEFNNRMLTLWLPVPSEKDRDRYSMDGQSMEDWKSETLVKKCVAFGGRPVGKSVEFNRGMLASVYVIQQIPPGQMEPRASIDMNAEVMPVTPEGEQLAADFPLDAVADEVPF